MVRARICALLGLFLMLAASTTEARELELSLEGRLGGDSNIFRVPTGGLGDVEQNSPGDGTFEFAPRIILRESNRALNYKMSYQPFFDNFFGTDSRTSGVNGVDHDARAAFDWMGGGADRAGFSASYTNNRRLRLDLEQFAADPDPTAIPSDGERSERGRVNTSYRKSLSPAWSSVVGYAFDDFSNSSSAVADTRSHSGSLGFDYVFDALTTFGVSGSALRRNSKVTDARGFAPIDVETDTDSYDVSLSISRVLTPVFDMSIKLGPSWLVSDQSNSANPSTTTDRNLSVFGSVDVTKTWRKGKASLLYSRSQSGASGSGTSSASIVDRVNFSLSHELSRAFKIGAVVSFSKFNQVGNGGIFSEDVEVDSWTAVWTAERRLTASWMLSGRFRYSNRGQTTTRFLGPQSTVSGKESRHTEIFMGFIALRYTFNPFVF
jgi:hypothetical protein